MMYSPTGIRTNFLTSAGISWFVFGIVMLLRRDLIYGLARHWMIWDTIGWLLLPVGVFCFWFANTFDEDIPLSHYYWFYRRDHNQA